MEHILQWSKNLGTCFVFFLFHFLIISEVYFTLLPALTRGKDHLPRPVGDALPNAAQDAWPSLLQGHIAVHQHCLVLLCEAAFQAVGSQPVLVWLFFLGSSSSRFSLLNFISSLFSSLLLRSLSTTHPNFVLCANLVRVCSVPSSSFLMMMLNATEPHVFWPCIFCIAYCLWFCQLHQCSSLN